MHSKQDETVCRERANPEYVEVALRMLDDIWSLPEGPELLTRGKPAGWTAGIMLVIDRINITYEDQVVPINSCQGSPETSQPAFRGSRRTSRRELKNIESSPGGFRLVRCNSTAATKWVWLLYSLLPANPLNLNTRFRVVRENTCFLLCCTC